MATSCKNTVYNAYLWWCPKLNFSRCPLFKRTGEKRFRAASKKKKQQFGLCQLSGWGVCVASSASWITHLLLRGHLKLQAALPYYGFFLAVWDAFSISGVLLPIISKLLVIMVLWAWIPWPKDLVLYFRRECSSWI